MSNALPAVVLTNVNADHLSRYDLLNWVNATLDSNFKQVEDMCSGVAYCQLLLTLYPKSIGLKKIKLNAKLETDFIYNFKLLQAALTNLKVANPIPIERLVRGKMQDNLEFLQWFKRFYEKTEEQLNMPKTEKSHIFLDCCKPCKPRQHSLVSLTKEVLGSSTQCKHDKTPEHNHKTKLLIKNEKNVQAQKSPTSNSDRCETSNKNHKMASIVPQISFSKKDELVRHQQKVKLQNKNGLKIKKSATNSLDDNGELDCYERRKFHVNETAASEYDLMEHMRMKKAFEQHQEKFKLYVAKLKKIESSVTDALKNNEATELCLNILDVIHSPETSIRK